MENGKWKMEKRSNRSRNPGPMRRAARLTYSSASPLVGNTNGVLQNSPRLPVCGLPGVLGGALPTLKEVVARRVSLSVEIRENRPHGFFPGGGEGEFGRAPKDGAVGEGVNHVGHDEDDGIEVAMLLQFVGAR